MHDPNTQAFVIPWRYRTMSLGGKPWRYWVPLVTIWHKDPERRGNDDSCGWFTPPFTEWQRELVKILAQDEAREPWFMRLDAKSNDDPVLCEYLVRGAFHLVSMCLRNRSHQWLAASPRECERWAIEMVHNPIDNFRNSLCFKSGYHSNWYRDGEPNTPEEDRFWREQQAVSFFGAILGRILRERRWWFQHPKWHVWHWRFQIHPLEHFKRWAFSRCCKCGGRFKWGASVGTNSWNSAGPSWRGEKDVYHMDCSRPWHDGSAEAMPADCRKCGCVKEKA
jgi:hypothetical protein